MDERIGAIETDDWATHVAFVRRLARSLVADAATADDLAQDAWVRFLDRPPRQSIASRGWFAAVLRNLVRFRARSLERRERRERDATRSEPQPAAADVVAQMDLHRRVVERVLALPEPYRAVIALRFHEQRSLAEIARQLDVPLETVKTRQKRALQQLRKELLDEREAGDGTSDRRAARWHGLVLLAQGGGGVAMTIGTKWGIAAAAGVVALALAAYELRPDAVRGAAPADLDARASAPAAVATPEPEVAAVAERSAEPPTPARTAEPPPAAALPFDGIHARVRGDVVDGVGQPLPGRLVEIFDRDGRTGEERVIARTTSDAQGRFELADVPFQRRTSGIAMAWDGSRCAGVAFDPRGGRRLHLVLGAVKSIVGHVVDDAGAPIAGAALIASTRHRDSRLADVFVVPDAARAALTVRSGADGSFALPDVPSGWKVVVEVSCSGFATRRESFELDDSAADVETTLVLLAETCIEGSVRFVDGSAAPGIRVGAQLRGDSFRARNNWGDAVTDATGHYVIHGLEAGAWNVLVLLSEAQEKEWCAAAGEGVKLTAAAPRARADFVLTRGGELIVNVVDATTGKPVAEQWIGIQSAARSSSGAAISSMISDVDGVARIRLPPGPVHAYLSSDSQRWSQQDGTLRDGETLELGVEVVVGVTLRGMVVGPDGAPVADAQVWSVGASRSMGRTPTTTTNEEGAFELKEVLPQPALRLLAAAKGLGMREPLVVESGAAEADSLELRLLARPENKVRGRVVDAAGTPVAGAEVGATDRMPENGMLGDPNSPDPATRTKSAADGTFELHGFWPGVDYVLNAVRLVETVDPVRVDVAHAEVTSLLEFEARDLLDLVLQPQQ